MIAYLHEARLPKEPAMVDLHLRDMARMRS